MIEIICGYPHSREMTNAFVERHPTLLVLADAEMPVICALPDDPLLEKVISNLQ
ncbi:MAG: hypothetical protein KZQ95_17090 [Candidatus Thiodiazotropha sp. (ex Epidulcina cf. delphinae)]|nr:hypothetical protein [Candidatus Thiodiazotropha sp. (ex Epidulcina cf. delphinae)]